MLSEEAIAELLITSLEANYREEDAKQLQAAATPEAKLLLTAFANPMLNNAVDQFTERLHELEESFDQLVIEQNPGITDGISVPSQKEISSRAHLTSLRRQLFFDQKCKLEKEIEELKKENKQLELLIDNRRS